MSCLHSGKGARDRGHAIGRLCRATASDKINKLLLSVSEATSLYLWANIMNMKMHL